MLDAQPDGGIPADTGQAVDVATPDDDRLLALTLSRPTDAFTQASRLLAQGPDARTASVAHQARAIVLRTNGRIAEAIAELRVALRLARTLMAPERACDVQATLGVTLALAGRTAAGLAALDAAGRASTGVIAGRVLARRGGLLGETRTSHRGGWRISGGRSHSCTGRGDTVWEARARSNRFRRACRAWGRPIRADRDLAIAARLFAAAGQELESAACGAQPGRRGRS